MRDDSKKPIDVSDLHYYFDAQERDSLDRQGYSRRTSEVLTIRDRLLALPQRDFDTVVQTIKNMLNPGQGEGNSPESRAKRKDATELYDKVRTERSSSSLKPNPI